MLAQYSLVSSYAKDGISVWASNVLPLLLPFIILSKYRNYFSGRHKKSFLTVPVLPYPCLFSCLVYVPDSQLEQSLSLITTRIKL